MKPQAFAPSREVAPSTFTPSLSRRLCALALASILLAGGPAPRLLAAPSERGKPVLMGQGLYHGVIEPEGGDLKIECRRNDDVHCTELVITSRRLPEIDKREKGTSVRYTVYCALEEDGEFKPIRYPAITIRVGERILPEVIDGDDKKLRQWITRPRRIAKNKALYPDTNGRGLFNYKEIEDRGIYYMVGEQWFSRSGRRSEEATSNVVGPGKVRLIVKGFRRDGKDRYKASPNLLTTSFSVIAGLDNQYVRFPDRVVESIVAKSDGWTGYFFWRADGYVPFKPEGITVTVEAKAKDTIGSGTISFVADKLEAYEAKVKKIVDPAKEDHDRRVAGLQKEIADAPKWIQKYEAEIATREAVMNKRKSYSEAVEV
ncbi:MAG: hypothetical protein HQ582_16765, partial [Planctomycetes bacterium]|nr:hypothetical protein [Planctomycetota bacterium]